MDNRIVDKIRKLLALSESSNEHESKLAMLKAQELLAKHKMTLKDVENADKVEVKKHYTDVTFTKAKWKGRLASIIADNFGCYVFYSTRNTHRIVFLGKEEDVLVCEIVLSYAIDCINSSVARLRREYYREQLSAKGLESDYAMGFLDGLESSFDKQKSDNQEWGLVLVKDEVVVKSYEDMTFTRTVYTDEKFKGHDEAYTQGVKDGEKFSITDKIASESESA